MRSGAAGTGGLRDQGRRAGPKLTTTGAVTRRSVLEVMKAMTGNMVSMGKSIDIIAPERRGIGATTAGVETTQNKLLPYFTAYRTTSQDMGDYGRLEHKNTDDF